MFYIIISAIAIHNSQEMKSGSVDGSANGWKVYKVVLKKVFCKSWSINRSVVILFFFLLYVIHSNIRVSVTKVKKSVFVKAIVGFICFQSNFSLQVIHRDGNFFFFAISSNNAAGLNPVERSLGRPFERFRIEYETDDLSNDF